jgi:hypothetical protein
MAGGTFPQLAAAMRGEKKYWGVSASPADTEAFIESLPGHATSTVCGTTFTVNATVGTKIYFAYPTHFGAVVFSVNGFGGGFVLRSTVAVVTDTLNVSRSYYLYESVSAGLGTTTVTVSPAP